MMVKRKSGGKSGTKAKADDVEDHGELLTTALVIDEEMHRILQAVALKRAKRGEGGRPSASKLVRGILDKHRAALIKEAGPYLDLM